MNSMKIILIFFLLFTHFSPQQKQRLEYKNGVPTTLGIDRYVNSIQNQKDFINEYQKLIKDSLYNDIFFHTETPPKEKKRPPLAYNLISLSYSCEIVVNNQENYKAFTYDTLKANQFTQEDNFLKATIFHEISHYYFYQCMLEMEKIQHVEVNQYYTYYISMFPNRELQYGSKFIEEGLCEYIVQKWKLCPEFIEYLIPQRKSDFEDSSLDFDLQYVYASKYLKDFLDLTTKQYGSLKEGIKIILSNNPPNYNEILHPELYFNRLK